jgi:hypothetical protein
VIHKFHFYNSFFFFRLVYAACHEEVLFVPTILKEWITLDSRNTTSTTKLGEEEIVGAPGNDGNASMPEQVKRPNPWRKMMIIIIFILNTQWNSREESVGIPTWLLTEWLLNWGSIPQYQQHISLPAVRCPSISNIFLCLFPGVQTGWQPTASHCMRTAGCFLRGKQASTWSWLTSNYRRSKEWVDSYLQNLPLPAVH